MLLRNFAPKTRYFHKSYDNNSKIYCARPVVAIISIVIMRARLERGPGPPYNNTEQDESGVCGRVGVCRGTRLRRFRRRPDSCDTFQSRDGNKTKASSVR